MTDPTEANFYQARVHVGAGADASPAEVARLALRQIGFDLQACLAKDPSLALTLSEKPGFIQDIINFAKEQKDG